MRAAVLVMVLAGGIWGAAPLAAQDDGGAEGASTYGAFLEQVTQEMGGTAPAAPGSTAAASGPRSGAPGLGYSATDAQRAELGRALYEDHIAALEYNRQVFEWQMLSTKVSFWSVIGLVGAGLIFAGIQFRRAMSAPPGSPEDMGTDLELSSKGVKVSSPVLGVIILALSLGFFYLYLAHIYPIEHVRGSPPASATAAD